MSDRAAATKRKIVVMFRTFVVAVIAWGILCVLLAAFVYVLPASVGLAIAATLILGPLVVWAFHSDK